jgi:hypothetical protein
MWVRVTFLSASQQSKRSFPSTGEETMVPRSRVRCGRGEQGEF